MASEPADPTDEAGVTWQDTRITYDVGALDLGDLDADPLTQFRRWLDVAITDGAIREPNAMALATVDATGRPWVRTVLLRGFDERGFHFFTNYASVKAEHLDANPAAALVFHWAVLHRQVCVRGEVERLSVGESDAYFARRPRGHQLGAWGSLQSEPIADRTVLEDSVAEAERRFAGADIPRPPHWGGYLLRPAEVEFWQGRPNRLHDRFVFTRAAGGDWTRQRLAP